MRGSQAGLTSKEGRNKGQNPCRHSSAFCKCCRGPQINFNNSLSCLLEALRLVHRTLPCVLRALGVADSIVQRAEHVRRSSPIWGVSYVIQVVGVYKPLVVEGGSLECLRLRSKGQSTVSEGWIFHLLSRTFLLIRTK